MFWPGISPLELGFWGTLIGAVTCRVTVDDGWAATWLGGLKGAEYAGAGALWPYTSCDGSLKFCV